MMFPYKFDKYLQNIPPNAQLKGYKRFIIEFLFFGIKQARSCLFAGLFFLAIFCIPRHGIWIFPRYDVLLFIAICIQVFMLIARLESIDEAKAIMFFHLIGFLLEWYKISIVSSWSYNDFAYTKLCGVPLFSGFMYAAIGSYIIQAWRLFSMRVQYHPPYYLAIFASVLIYINFFTHHIFGDYRWYITCFLLGIYARSIIYFTPYDKERNMPLLLSFILVGFFIWLAENINTFLGIWTYPNQLGAWSLVHIGKWSSWSMLIVMTFTITLYLKNIKSKIHIAQ